MSVIIAPSVFTSEEDIQWITCKRWATGGSTDNNGVKNSGTLNAPLISLLGNTKYLHENLINLLSEFNLHLSDPNAHSAIIDARLLLKLSGWAIPPEKIKASLSESVGITNSGIQSDAGIVEGKLNLTLAGKTRPLVSQSLKNTYEYTSDLAADMAAIYRRILGYSGSFNTTTNANKAVSLSGWLIPLAQPVDQLSPGSLTVSGNRITMIQSPDQLSRHSFQVAGIPFFFKNTLSDLALSPPLPDVGPLEISQLCELGVEQELFLDCSSPTVYENEDTDRQDMLFIEVWPEVIPEVVGKLFQYGNVQTRNQDHGYAGFRYKHSSDFLPISGESFGEFVQSP
jgi:hypothetical protein